MENEKMKDYIAYLDRYCKKHKLFRWQAHQHLLCREAARECGLTEEELIWLDENL